MAKLSKIELHALEAIDNEAQTATKAERDQFIHQLRAYQNAASYADQWGYDVEKFRAVITKLTGVTKEEAGQ